MFKFTRNVLAAGIVSLGLVACGDDVTIVDPPLPPPPGVTSVTVAPASATVAVGQNVIFAASVIADAGVSTAVTWTSSAPAIASVDANTGKVIGVAPGTTTIVAKSTADAGKTGVASVTVSGTSAGGPVQISIQSITQGLFTLPVVLTNVNGQIEVNMNFNSNGAPVDSINVFIGNKRAAKAVYAASPAAGLISLSINTAEFTTPAASPTALVTYLNGSTGITAVAYPTGAATPTATQATPIILTNADGWAGKMTKPTVATNNAGGITYWGGPTANVSAQIWAVQYNGGRNGIETVTWTVGGCSTTTAGGVVGVQIATALTRSFGYTANGAQTACTSYEWLGGNMDNIIVTAAIDGVNSGFPLTPLIANTVVFGSTPDSLRLDYLGPTVTPPTISRSAPAVTGWVNATFNFIAAAASFDAGVGIKATSDRTTSYTSTNCPGVVAVNVPMPTNTGADINGGVACPTNFIGGAVGLGSPGTAPWRVRSSESDRLNNVGTSALSQTFGTDYTAPQIRNGVGQVLPLLPDAVYVDSVFITKPVAGTDVFRAEFLDERSGFVAASEKHSLSLANHANGTGLCGAGIGIGTGTPGATFITAQTCTKSTATLGVARVDGWLAGQQVDIPAGEGYYSYRATVTDQAGNVSSEQNRETLINANAPFTAGMALASTLTSASFNFVVAYADSAELKNHALDLRYPNVGNLRYPQQAIGVTFDNNITSPFFGNISPATGAPYARGIEVVNGNAFATSNIDAASLATAKPDNATAMAFNPANFFLGTPTIAIPALNVQNGAGILAYNVANPTAKVGHWRVIATTSSLDQFGSTVPLRVQTVANINNSVNAPFVRVDFYRLDVGGWWNYLGSSSTPVLTDVLPNRSWLWALPDANFVKQWNGTANAAVAPLDNIRAVGVLSNGDAVTTAVTVMTP